MALGIPTVMSTVGVGPDLASGGAALLAGDPQGWRDSIASLIRDAGARRAYGEAGRARVVEQYSVHANLPRYREVLQSLS
jgi:glycosyltransferase involved in cell wall biosynthesis